MNKKAISFLKNFFYTFTTNLTSLIISILIILIVPKLLGVEEYGYWQLYLFYSSYVGFLHFGWNDGIYLRYGGKTYKELDKNLMFSQFYMLLGLQILLSIVMLLGVFTMVANENRQFILIMTLINMVIVNSRYFFIYILQGTNRIKEYAQLTIMERLLYVLLIILFLSLGLTEFKLLIIADIVGKVVTLIYAMYCCKEIAFKKVTEFYFNFKEVRENIVVGIKLMFANIASKLILGVVRFGIERTWSVAVFGKVSLTLSVSNFLMIFIDTIGLIMFPILRRTEEKKLPELYNIIRDFLMFILLATLILYYPLKLVLSAWLPTYADSLVYMAMLFPVVVYEGKTALLINTYLKTLRKEKLMLRINLTSLGISLIMILISTIWMNSLDLAVLSIVISLAFRSILSEVYLSKIFQMNFYKDIVLELIIVVIFITVGWNIDSWWFVVIYGVTYLFYLIIKRKDLINSFRRIQVLIRD